MNHLYRKKIAKIELCLFCIMSFIIMVCIVEEADQVTMQPFFKGGDWLVLNYLPKKSYDYGDVVLCQFEGRENKSYILRIVGLPGDRIAIKDNTCIINNQKNSCRLITDSVAFSHRHKWSLYYTDEIEEEFPNGKKVNLYIEREVKVNKIYEERTGTKEYVPEASLPSISIDPDYYYVLGDTRTRAVDSRLYGLVPKRNIKAQIVKVFRTEE